MIEIIATLLMGIAYGLLIGIIPSVGATTGLVAVFSFIHLFSATPYLGVLFCVAVVASSTTGDTFASVMLGIPGANSSAATMVDGFPLACQGKATYALSAAITTSTINGLVWGCLAFLLMPFYAKIILFLGIPELWAFTVLAFLTVSFISSKYWVRSIIALAIGVWFGVIGLDANASPLFTFGWAYLEDGIQIIPVVAGLFAIPELLASLKAKYTAVKCEDTNHKQQRIDGIRVAFKEWKLGAKGGIIGSFIGILPGLGGAVADWLAYGQAVASNPKEKFGNGNIKGVIGCEGANNAQKASSFIPTVLFGIPGAPFAAILMALFMYLDFEMGTLALAADATFFGMMSVGFIAGTLITGLICLLVVHYITYIAYIPYKYYFPFLITIIMWATLQYTGGWEDIAMLCGFTIVGMLAKKFNFSRPSLLIGFILSDKILNLSYQMMSLYSIGMIFSRPLFLGIMMLAMIILYVGIKNKNRLEYN